MKAKLPCTHQKRLVGQASTETIIEPPAYLKTQPAAVSVLGR